MRNASSNVGALFTDLYELTMAQGYIARGMTGIAVFETFFRELPPERGYIVAAGLADVIDYLEAFRFAAEDLDALYRLGVFSDELLDRLATLRFTGDVWAMPEGSIVFPNEPIVQVVAPIVEAQLLETFVLNQIHFQTVIASKAARIVQAARGRTVVDFGSRRAHGTDAGLKVARASYLAGATGTSNVLAASAYGIPALGTMAHSFVQAFADEADAFAAFAEQFPRTTLLVDTYDTLRGVDRVIELARRLGDRFAIRAVRLDSGDLGELAKTARAKLDAVGLRDVEIFVSSGLDEHEIAALLAVGSPIDGFGVGTQLATSSDAPALDMAYKLVEYDGRGRTKLSSKKTIYPGRKQVFRQRANGVFVSDTLARADEQLPGERMLLQVMAGGQRLGELELGLEAARAHAAAQLAALAPAVRSLEAPIARYPVRVSERIASELACLREALRT